MPVSAAESDLDEIHQLLIASESMRTSSQSDRLDQAAALANQALARLEQVSQKDVRGAKRLMARALKLRGMADEGRRTPQDNVSAVRAYDGARRLFVEVMDATNATDLHELGSIWTHRGMTLLNSVERRDWREARVSFDEAISSRRKLPLQENWLYPWGLAASLMNRGEALTKLGSTEELNDAVGSYDEALSHLANVPSGAHAGAVRQREIVAWLNRGLALQAQKTEESFRRALQSFERAIALVQLYGDAHYASCRRILACALINRSIVLLDISTAEATIARQSALQALRVIADTEKTEYDAAEAGLKARHALCRALAWLIESSAEAEEGKVDWIAEITDVIDEALTLARHWAHAPGPHIQSTAIAMFRLGCLIFGAMQPHFLADYLLDHLDPQRTPDADVRNRDLHIAAQEALWQCASGVRQRGASERQLEKSVRVLNDLQAAAGRLAHLRETYLTDDKAVR